MKSLSTLCSLTLALLLVLACKTPSEKMAENPSSTRDTTYEAGVLVFKVRDDLKTTLPTYDHSAPALGEYPYLGDLLPAFEVKSIAPFVPRSGLAQSDRFYKIHFDASVSLEEFIAALGRVDVIEFAEKVPVNSPK